MSKIDNFLSDPRYTALDDAGKKTALDKYFNKYVPQDARYQQLDEKGRKNTYDKFMAKYYGETKIEAPKRQPTFEDTMQILKPDLSLNQPAIRESTQQMGELDRRADAYEAVMKDRNEANIELSRLSMASHSEAARRTASAPLGEYQGEGDFISSRITAAREMLQPNRYTDPVKRQVAKEIVTEEKLSRATQEYRRIAEASANAGTPAERRELHSELVKTQYLIDFYSMGRTATERAALQAGTEAAESMRLAKSVGAGALDLGSAVVSLFAPDSKWARTMNSYTEGLLGQTDNPVEDAFAQVFFSMPMTLGYLIGGGAFGTAASAAAGTAKTASMLSSAATLAHTVNINSYLASKNFGEAYREYGSATAVPTAVYAAGTLSAILETAVEMYSDVAQSRLVLGHMKKLGKTGAEDYVRRSISGKLRHYARRYAGSVAEGTITEMLEEAIQNSTSMVIDIVSGQRPTPTAGEAFKEIGYSALIGGLGGLTFGLAGGTMSQGIHYNDWRQVNKLAKSGNQHAKTLMDARNALENNFNENAPVPKSQIKEAYNILKNDFYAVQQNKYSENDPRIVSAMSQMYDAFAIAGEVRSPQQDKIRADIEMASEKFFAERRAAKAQPEAKPQPQTSTVQPLVDKAMQTRSKGDIDAASKAVQDAISSGDRSDAMMEAQSLVRSIKPKTAEIKPAKPRPVKAETATTEPVIKESLTPEPQKDEVAKSKYADTPYKEIQAKAKEFGINPVGKKKVDLIKQIEAKEASQAKADVDMAIAKQKREEFAPQVKAILESVKGTEDPAALGEAIDKLTALSKAADSMTKSEISVKKNKLQARKEKWSIDDLAEVKTKQSKAMPVGKVNETVDRRDPAESGVIPKERIGKKVTVVKENQEIDVKYALVDIDDVIVSNDVNDDFKINPSYPPELQNRNREEQKASIIKKAVELRPDLLEHAAVASDGRPIAFIDTNGRTVVIAGNERAMAVKLRHEGQYGDLSQYESYMKGKLSELGIADQDTKGKMIVAIYSGDTNLITMARLLNVTESKKLSPTEEAKSDATEMANAKQNGDDIFMLLDGKTRGIMTEANKPFIDKFIELNIRSTEIDTYMDGEDYTPAFRERIENALFMYMFNNSKKAERLLSGLKVKGDSNVKAVLKGIIANTKAIVRLRNLIAEYNLTDLDITEDLLDIVAEIDRLRAEGKNVEQAAFEMDLFSEGQELIPDDKLNLYMTIARIKSQAKAEEFIAGYYRAADSALDPEQMSFQYEEASTKEEFLNEYAKEWLGDEAYIPDTKPKRADAKSDQASQVPAPVKTAEDSKAENQDIDKLYNGINTAVAGKDSQDMYMLKRDLGLLLMPKVRVQEAESVADYYIALREGSVTQAQYDNYIDELIAENRVNDTSDAEKVAARERVDAYRNKKAEDSKPKQQSPKDDGYIRINIGDLIEHYKAMGMDRQRAWKEYIQDTVLSKRVITDSIDSKDFMPYFDRIQFPKKSDKMMPKQQTADPVKAAEDGKARYEALKQAIQKLSIKGRTVAISNVQKELGLTRKEMIALLDEVHSGKYGGEIEFGSARDASNRYLKPDSAESKNREWKFAATLSIVQSDNKAEGVEEYAGTERLVTPEPPAPLTRSTFHAQYKAAQKGKLTAEQITAQLSLYDALMETYAKEMGITLDEAYAQTIESVTDQEAGQPTPAEVAKEESGMRTQVDESYAPKKTKIAYKLFRTLKTRPGEIFPLFIGKSDPTPIGKWIKAEFIPTKGYQERPGWHLGFAPYAPHLRANDGSMNESRVWYEVEIPDDVDWQTKADATKTGDIRGEVPEGGYYTFKRPGAQGGEWKIAGAIKVIRPLSLEEVNRIKAEKGISDTRYQTTDMPSAAEIAEAERQMAEVRAKYEGTDWHKSLPTWETITRMNNVIDTPYDQKIKEGALFRDPNGYDPYIYETRYVNPKDYIDKVHLEGETYDKVVSMPTTQKYIEWYKQGYEPPPMSLVVHYKNGLSPTERRRWVAAIEAGVKKVPALVEIGRASEMPNHPGYLKAPNGKPTKLNERQWLQVRTQNFLDWFGDWINDPKNSSKVVDENGEPMVVYHGGEVESEFSPTKSRRGFFFFAQDKGAAEYYASSFRSRLVEAFLSSPNILDLMNPYSVENKDFMSEYAEYYDEWVDRASGEKTSPQELIDAGTLWDYEGSGSGNRWYDLFALAKTMGYDGVKVNDITIRSEEPTYVVFSPTQIKSATANVGTFDPQNPDIRYSIAMDAQEDSNQFPIRPIQRRDYSPHEYADVVKEHSSNIKKWKEDVTKWVETMPDVITFKTGYGYEVVSKDTTKDGEGRKWRVTYFSNEYVPQGHYLYSTKAAAVIDAAKWGNSYAPDIRFQQLLRGYIQQQPDGKFRIGFLSPNISTGLHEQAHLGKSLMERLAAQSPVWQTRLDTAAEWSGATKTDTGWQWTPEAEEKFAMGYEKYLQTGGSPNSKLATVFAKIKEWMAAIATKLTRLDGIELSPEIVSVYEAMLGITEVKPNLTSKQKAESVKIKAEMKKAGDTKIDPAKLGKSLDSLMNAMPSLVMTSKGKRFKITDVNTDTDLVEINQVADGYEVNGKHYENNGEAYSAVEALLDKNSIVGIDIRKQEEIIKDATKSATKTVEERIAERKEKAREAQRKARAVMRKVRSLMDSTTVVAKWDAQMRKGLERSIKLAFPGTAPLNIVKYEALRETLTELDPGIEDHAKEISKIKAQLRRMVAMDKRFRQAVEDVSGYTEIENIPFEQLFKAMENTNPAAYDAFMQEETMRQLLNIIPRIKDEMGEGYNDKTLQMIVNVMLRGTGSKWGRDEWSKSFLQPQRMLTSVFGKGGAKTVDYGYQGTLDNIGYETEYTPQLEELHRLLLSDQNNRGSHYEGSEVDIIGRTIFEVDGDSEITNKLETIQERIAKWSEDNGITINSKDVADIYATKEQLKYMMRGFIAEWNANPNREQKIGVREDYDNPRNYNWGNLSEVTMKRDKYLYTPTNAKRRAAEDLKAELDYNTNIFEAYRNYMYAMTKYMAFYDVANYVENSNTLIASKGKVIKLSTATGFDLDVSKSQKKAASTADKEYLATYVKDVIGYHLEAKGMDRFLSAARTNLYTATLAANIAMTVLNYNQRNLIFTAVDPKIAWQVKRDFKFWSGLFKQDETKYPNLARVMQAYVKANQSLLAELAAEAKQNAEEGDNKFTNNYYKYTAMHGELLRKSHFSKAELGNRAWAHAAGVYQVAQNSQAYKDNVAAGMTSHAAMEKALADDPQLLRAAITHGGIINAEVNADANPAFSPAFFRPSTGASKLKAFLRYGSTITLLEFRTFSRHKGLESILSPDLFRLLTSGNVKAANAAQMIQAAQVMLSMTEPRRAKKLVEKGHASKERSPHMLSLDQIAIVHDAVQWALDQQVATTKTEFAGIIRGKQGHKKAVAALAAFSISEMMLRLIVELLFSLLPWWQGKKSFDETDIAVNISGILGLFQSKKTMSNYRMGVGLLPEMSFYAQSDKATLKSINQWVLRLTPYLGTANYATKVFTGKYASDYFWDEVYR